MPEGDLDIRREPTADGGRYVAPLPEGEAELVFRRLGPALVSADHTFTPPAARGRGVAAALVERLVADARAEGFRIQAKCPYVAAWLDGHPEAADVRAG
jgi:predicted GNAT family acetyltransferase